MSSSVQEIVDRLRDMDYEGQEDDASASYLVARDGEAFFAFPVDVLVETLEAGEKGIVPIPLSEPYIAGVVNVRSEMIPVILLSKILGIAGGSARFIVIIQGGFQLALAFEELIEIVSVPRSAFRPLHTMEKRPYDIFLTEEFDFEGNPVRAVDVTRLFESEYVR